MTFIFSKLFWYLVSPGNLFTLLILLGAICLAATRRRRGLPLVFAGALGLLAIIVLPVSTWAIAPLENRFPEPHLPARVDGFVVLGGAVEARVSAAHHQPAVNGAAERLFAAARLARMYPQARVVLSGGEATVIPEGYQEASVMRDILVRQGIAPDRLVIESKSRNTYENARNSYSLVHPKPGEVWVLITSAWHMPRAVGCFRKVGWSVIPYPVDYAADGASDLVTTYLLYEELPPLSIAIKEWIGLVVYRVLGRTDALFPAPRPPAHPSAFGSGPS